MALRRSCDNPACETALDVEPDEINDLPAGWWLLEHAAEAGSDLARYTLCSLGCVGEIAGLWAPLDDDGDAA